MTGENKHEDRRVGVGKDVTGSAIQSGDHNTSIQQTNIIYGTAQPPSVPTPPDTYSITKVSTK